MIPSLKNPGFYIAVLLLGILPLISYAQSDKQKVLNRIREDALIQHAVHEMRVEEYLKIHPETNRYFTSKEGRTYFLDQIDSSGIPVYINTFNLEAAISVGVHQLRQNGALGLNLTGKNIEVGVWEVSGLKSDHIEFMNRLRLLNTFVSVDNHASHVSGTIAASGINERAIGMAPEATILFHTANGDVNEMAELARPDQSGILISNHSYGTTAGWEIVNGEWQWFGVPSISDDEDFKFGFYDTKARDIDQLAYSAPYYTIVKAAGNDRTDRGDGSRPADGPYDAISTWGNSKNIITVGAIAKIPQGYTSPNDVSIASFSSYGPTDDGRIKPDITAPGEDLFSATSVDSASYGILSGTSMAAPTVSGSLALLQELYKEKNNAFLKASTLKALIIQSANQAVPEPGPNYRYGWGVLNAEGAARLILDEDDISTRIMELTINNDGTIEIPLNPVEGFPLKATIVWTDPAGPVSRRELDSEDLRLVNDLDMRLITDSGKEIFPYVLDPSNPRNPATRGDNFRDNVEQIVVVNPEPRRYTLRINHKGVLESGSQNFSLILTYSSRYQDSRRQLFFIGKNQEWEDPQNWSLTSGGGSANLIPGPQDRVIIDENSFINLSEPALRLGGDTEVRSFSWLAKESAIFDAGNVRLTAQAILINSNNLEINGSGQFYIKGSEGVSFNNLDFGDISLILDEEQAQWNILNSVLNFGSVEIKRGSVDFSGTHINTRSLKVSANASLTFDETRITGLDTLIIENGNDFENSSSEVIFTGSAQMKQLLLQNVSLNAGVSLQNGKLQVSGQNSSIQSIVNNGELVLFNSFTLDSLFMDTGASLVIEGGETLVIDHFWQFSSSEASPSRIMSNSQAEILLNSNNKYCTDYLVVENVNVNGSSKISSGLNSTIIDSEGWNEVDCDILLFADFNYEYNCVNGLTFFNNASSGNITGYEWNFGDGNSSDARDGFNSYSNTGEFTVTLTVFDENGSDEYSQVINIIENEPLSNKVVQDDERLVSEKSAESYQWFLNGERIDEAIDRFYSFNNQGGTYFVTAINGVCNNISDSLQVEITSLEPERLENQVSSLKIYPNPVGSVLYVEWPNHPGDIQVRITNLNGSVLLNEVLSNDGQKIDISTSDLSAGVYIIELMHPKQTIKRKLIK